MGKNNLKIISTPKIGYDSPGHPEHSGRVVRSLAHLRKILPSDLFQEPQPAPMEAIRAVHGEDLVNLVRNEDFIDMDTPGGPGVFNSSLLSAGAALEASREALKGVKIFSLMRPPGHHATPGQSMGFCYFNSMAVSLQALIKEGKAQKAAVLDLDVHHGNGTQDFCFGKPGLLFVSLHQFPAYPGTGQRSMDNCRNYPLPPGTQEGDYFPALEKAMGEIRAFQPDLIGVSMGFDTYEKDPLAQFGLTKEDYRTIGKLLKDFNIPSFALLEGGYHDDLPNLIEEFLQGWAG